MLHHHLTSRVGINAEERIDLSPYVTDLSGDYYSLHVFAASRSCMTNASLFSSFHWVTSSPAAPALEDLINHQVLLTPESTESTAVVWENGTALLRMQSFILLRHPQALFYRVEAELQMEAFSIDSYLCLVVHGVKATRPSALRTGVTENILPVVPCEMNGAKVAVMLTVDSG